MGIIKKKWRKKRMKSKNELSYKDLKMTCNENTILKVNFCVLRKECDKNE